MIPQDYQSAPEPGASNRPPAIDLLSVSPPEAVVAFNLDCPNERLPRFQAPVIELDLDQDLRVRWFLDYDLPGDDPAIRPLTGPSLVPPPVDGDRRLREVSLAPESFRDLLAPGPHTLEVFVVEADALEEDASQVPVWRALKDCTQEPEGTCVSTHPAVFRWTLDVRDEVCP